MLEPVFLEDGIECSDDRIWIARHGLPAACRGRGEGWVSVLALLRAEAWCRPAALERHMVGYLLTAADFIDNGACQWRKRVQAIRNSSILEALYQLRAAA